MAYSFEQVFAADPSNPANVARNAAVTIFAPGDIAQTPLTLTTPNGDPLANPLQVNNNGFGSAFMHATLDRVAWAGGNFTGFFTSYEGMKAEAVSARTAAQTAATNAGSAAAADVAARIAAGEFVGAPGQDGSNVLPTDTAIKDAINNPASQTKAALSATIDDKVTEYAAPVSRVPALVYDEFSRYPNGALAGKTPLVGPVWQTTGSGPVTVVSGNATTTDTGYAYVTLADKPEAAWADVAFTVGTSAEDKPMTIAFCLNAGATMLDNFGAHFNWGPRSYALQVRKDGEDPFPYLFQGAWSREIPAGEYARVGIVIRGATATIFGPYGETRSITDPRIQELNGTTLFWEPRAVNGSNCLIRSVTATGREDAGVAGGFATLADLAGAGKSTDDSGRAVGSPETMAQVAAGIDPGNRMPSVFFGAFTIRTVLEAAVAIGATTITTDIPIPPGSTLILESGGKKETIVSGALSTGVQRPYTTTLNTATTKTHAKGTVVVATPTATSRTSMYLNASNGQFFLPNLPVLVAPGGKFYLGTALDTFIERDGTGPTVGFSRPTRSKPYTTAARPTAASVGPGAHIYDTTLGKPCWSDGTNWKDAAGTVV